MLLAEIDGASLDITGAQIPMEPSYLILNTAGTYMYMYTNERALRD